MSVADYIRLKERRKSFPGKIVNGEMFVFCCGEWMPKNVFDELIPKVIVPDFSTNMLNVDRTKMWMHQ